ncbi:hypothetical protein NPIL_118291 [Nephila pilipes]|uniref:Uncharacterized protein n=1 Tax=Nephila pilipes TaxID=299642 RepID=A0A8X6QB08_NEPPI|nr:hypothetical protein NPIL_118291 [Nephila pilipes]
MQNSNLYFSNPGSSISKIMSQETIQSGSFSNFRQLENKDISLQLGYSNKSLNYSGRELDENALFDKEQTSIFLNYLESLSNETSTHFKKRECSVYNLGEINESCMEQSNSGIYYPEIFSNRSISQNQQQSTKPLIYEGSVSNEIFTDFTEQQMQVHDSVTTTGGNFSYGFEESKSYLSYPEQMYSENNSSSVQQTSPFLLATSLKSSESISNDIQPSSILMNYAG